jgi:hypothetical protein
MDEQLVGTLTYGDYKAEIFSTNLPGEFKVSYQDATGKRIEEAPLTGISSYKQRENEIADRLRQLSEGAEPAGEPDRGDPGEY